MAQNLVVGGDTYEGVERVAATNTDGETIVYPEGGDTASNAVRYVHQTLADEEKAQARQNINAMGSDDIYFRYNAYAYNGNAEHINTVTINVKKVVDGKEVVESVEIGTTTLYEHARLHGYEGEITEFYDSLAKNMQTLKGDGLLFDPVENLLYITYGGKPIGRGVFLPSGGAGGSLSIDTEEFLDTTGSGYNLEIKNTDSEGETYVKNIKIYHGKDGVHGTDVDLEIEENGSGGYNIKVKKTEYYDGKPPYTSITGTITLPEQVDSIEYDEKASKIFLLAGGERISDGTVIPAGIKGDSTSISTEETEDGYELTILNRKYTSETSWESELETIEIKHGQKGDPGESGVTTPVSGFFTLSVDADGNLWAHSAEGGTTPDFEYDSETGNLYFVTE